MKKPFEIRVAPERVGISSAAIEKMLDKMDNINMHGVMVVRHGMVAAEGYWKPFSARRLHRLYSVTKSVTSAAIGILIGEGKVRLEDKVIDYFPDVQPETIHPWHADMTLRDMLIMATPHYRTSYYGHEMNWLETFWKMEPDHAPGTIFEYDTAASMLMCHMIKRITGQEMTEYLRSRLLDPIGASPDISCVRTPEGVEWGGSGMLATLRDMAKIGYVFMNGGRWGDRQLIPEWYCRQATASQIDNSLISGGNGYGYQIWVEKNNGFAFRGMGGQFMFAYPDKDLVIACHADTQFDPKGIDNKRLPGAMEALAETVTQDELPEDKVAAAHLQARLDSLMPKALAGKMDSPLREKISGAVYDITTKNAMGWQEVRFELSENEGTIHYRTDRGDKAISFGFGFRKEGFFPENHYWGRRINEPKNAPYACEASAAWVQEDKLAIRVYITDDYLAGMQMEFAFKGDEIALRMKKVAEFFLNEYEGFAGGYRREETV